MRKIIAFMHMSLDGFVAGPNGEMNWIKADEEIFDHISKRISDTNTALYGRVTYEMMESYWPSAADEPNASRHDIEHSTWYKKAHKIVMSKTLNNAGLTNITIISKYVADNINDLKQQPGDEILLFGSPGAMHSLMQQNLIDGCWLFVNPIILGHGIPMFTDIQAKIRLKLLTSRQFASGVVELNYTMDR